MYSKILYEVKDRIAFISLNNGKMNPIDDVMSGELVTAFEELEKDPEVKAVVVRGGEKAFSAGGDANNMAKGLEEGWLLEYRNRLLHNLTTMTLLIRKSSKPFLASVRGAAAGAGFNLAFACDMCICADNVKFVPAFAKLGLIPDTGGIFILSKIFGISKAIELCLLARVMPAQEAFDLGAVCEICPAEELEEKTLAIARTLAGNAVLCNKYIKSLAWETCFKDLEAYMELEHKYIAECGETEDFAEGVRALLEKRPAKFK